MAAIIKKILLGGCVIGCAAALFACGNTGGGSDSEDNNDSVFVPNNVGTVSLEVGEDLMSVSDSTGFSVQVTNSSGQPVPNTRVSCDSELGIGIIEPSTGTEITDSGGHISGRVGCELPGSYLFGCRVAVGAAKRKFVTLRCSGPIPAGFDGFGGAGGGLGTGGTGGTDNGGSDGNDTDNGITVTAVRFNDSGGSDSASFDPQIDITQQLASQAGGCDGDATTNDPEPFFDTLVSFDVKNSSNSNVTFTGYFYRVSSAGVTTDQLAFLNSNVVTVSAGDTVTLQSLFAHATGGAKQFANGTQISALGFTNVRITLVGTNDQGDSIQVSNTTVVSFDNYNNCA